MFTYLFILAIEILLIRVRDSELVRCMPVIDKEIKLDAYADDGRFFLKDLQSLYTISDITEEFATFSSLKLNLQKSETFSSLKLNLQKSEASRFNIDFRDIHKLQINNLLISTTLLTSPLDIKNILSIWRLRGLSLAGRIQVFKALALSKAVFICTMKPYSKKFVDDLNEVQNDFIWRSRKPKIKHTSLIGDYSEGDMKDIDIKAKLECLRKQWVKRLIKKTIFTVAKSSLTFY